MGRPSRAPAPLHPTAAGQSYVLDIACRQLTIGIELDGGHHGEQIERDEARTTYFAAHG
ncbi:DUF559 domain-containing protein [Sphingomonas melonis]